MPCRIYRNLLRGYVRLGLLTREVDNALMGVIASYLTIADLEAACELAGVDYRALRPKGYRPHH